VLSDPLTIGDVRVPLSASTVIKLLDVEFTVRVKLVVFLSAPAVAVTVMVWVPVGVDDEVAMFRVREQVGVQEFELE
jgi:hypothetical protein